MLFDQKETAMAESAYVPAASGEIQNHSFSRDAIRQEHAEYIISQEDEGIQNHTYKEEQALLDVVKRGDIEQVRENCRTGAFVEYPNLVSYSDKKNEEYMAAITIALVARTAIEAGVSSNESFQLSDVYLKKLSTQKSIREIIELRNDAVVAFTEMVHRHKNMKKSNAYIAECKHYIATNVFKKISTTEIADALGLSPIYLERIFKAEENMTIGQYIQKAKVIRAQNLLIYSDRSILEISEYLSFCSQSHFGKVFQNHVGMTPRQFRKTHHVSRF